MVYRHEQLKALQDLIGESQGVIYPSERLTIAGAYKFLELNPNSRTQVSSIANSLRGVRETVGLYQTNGKPRSLLTRAISILEEIAA